VQVIEENRKILINLLLKVYLEILWKNKRIILKKDMNFDDHKKNNKLYFLLKNLMNFIT